MGAFKAPHGGDLVDLYLSNDEAEREKGLARDYTSWDLTARQVCDLELILNGGFSPLEGFMGQADVESVLKDMRLSSGVLWPLPITLDVTRDFADSVSVGDSIALRDAEGVLIATMKLDEIFEVDKTQEAMGSFGTTDDAHPSVHYLNHIAHPVYLAGKLRGIEKPMYYDFRHLRDSPAELRWRFEKLGWRRVVAFQTRHPMHRAHQELTLRAARDVEANLLIHPVVGMTKPGDIDHFTRVRCYEHIMREYPDQTTTLSLLPLAMRMAGPREAIWHGIVRKNYGCTHFIVSSDQGSPGKDASGKDFYAPNAAQELFKQHEKELDITMVPVSRMVYVTEKAQYLPIEETTDLQTTLDISGTEVRRRMQEGLEIEDWFSYPDVIKELRRTHPPRHQRGFTVFFTGLSGSGKSTIANALMVKMMEQGDRNITLLDGDLVRKNLSSELGFSREHRDLNVLRIGYVASEITKNGGIAICAPIAPYMSTRRQVRDTVTGASGGFIEVHVATPIEVCENRDRKGLYEKARAGIIKEFTGISDPYETPENPEVVIDTSELSPELAAQRILIKIEALGYLK